MVIDYTSTFQLQLLSDGHYKSIFFLLLLMFSSTIRDIHANLEVQVFDEDRDRKVEYLGKVAIPLLRVSVIKYCILLHIIS